MKRTAVLWHDRLTSGAEYCLLDERPAGFRLAGSVVRPVDGVPLSIRYVIDTDEGWRTRRVLVRVVSPGAGARLALASDGAGAWRRDGVPLPEGGGCLDVDLGCTPATNTLPIRRLRLKPGESADVAALWIGVPDLATERLEQGYEHVGNGIYRYAAGSFTAMLSVGDDGLVRDYGDAWRAVAVSTAVTDTPQSDGLESRSRPPT